MRVLVTGASGHIGSALVPELLNAGHQVLGLARSEESAGKLEAAGVDVVRGSLEDLDVLRNAAASVDGVIHLAYRHDLVYAGDMGGADAADAAAIDTIGSALEGTGKAFVGVSGTLMLTLLGITDRPSTEDDLLPDVPMAARENRVVALADRGVRASVVRLAPVVHSDLDKEGFIPVLVGLAKAAGNSAYIGDGTNRWSAVNTYDAAALLRLAVESAPAGSRLHGASEGGIALKDIATAIGAGLDLPLTGVTVEQAPERFSFLAMFAAADNPVTDNLTRERLGWNPTHPGLLDDLRTGFYFAS